MSERIDAEWTVLVPLKPPELAKSRLALPRMNHTELARAIAQDTLDAVAQCDVVAQLIVVSAANTWRLGPRGLLVHEESPRGIDIAVRAAETVTSVERNRAVLVGDLAGLQPDDLAVALNAAARVDRGVVADHAGSGSTLVSARAGHELITRFGPESLKQHRAAGLVEIDLAGESTVRRDVDTTHDLTTSVGPHTRRLLTEAGIIAT